MGLGLPSALAGKLGAAIVGVTTAGTAQGTATALTVNAFNLLTTAASQTGAILPAGSPGDCVLVFTNTATTAVIYPATGGTIQNGSANAGVNLAQNKAMLLYCRAANTWIYLLTA